MNQIIHNGGARWGRIVAAANDQPLSVLSSELIQFFPDQARGAPTWRETFSAPTFNERTGRGPLRLDWDVVRAIGSSVSEVITRNVVFLSHRQQDQIKAEQLADAILLRTRFDVWLDIWDPNLPRVKDTPFSKDQKAVLIALIIEMGLINSKSVIALMTDDSDGSEWIPYEYGRVKQGGPVAQEACAALRDRTEQIPEYMLLGARCKHTQLSKDVGGYEGLEAWLDSL